MSEPLGRSVITGGTEERDMQSTDVLTDWDSYVAAENRRTVNSNLLRVPRVLHPSSCGVRVSVPRDNSSPHSVTLFSTNDYLGLSSHPQVQCAIATAAASCGQGPRSAAIVAGHTSLHETLERRLASLKKAQACLLFPTGFAANVATISALAADSSVALFSDELNHASLIDGCRLARNRGAQTHVFRHRDYHHLHALLQQHSDRPRKIVVTDGVFSMDGDLADLQELCRLRAEHRFLLLVDDAHGTLVLGKNGGGVADMTGTSCSVDVHVGTLSKAVGAHGGFVACSHAIKTLLVNKGRAYVYSTALPVPTVAGALAALNVFDRERWRVEHLQKLQKVLSVYLSAPVDSPIVPLVVGSPERAMRICAELWQAGFHVPAIRPPTVPSGTSRLRLSLSAEHTVVDVMSLIGCIKQQFRTMAIT
eukprot:jgi/Ulvmu1/432/UM001_0439.1